MLTPEAKAEAAAFKARKLAQWERIVGPGLQMIQSGEDGTQFVLAREVDGVVEGIVFGQLPHVVVKRSGSPKNPVIRAVENDRKPFEKRAIDLTDEEIAAVLASWDQGKSARWLSGITAMYRNGKLVFDMTVSQAIA